MVLSADGMTACFQRHDVIAGRTGKQIKQWLKGAVSQVFHGGDNGGGPVLAYPWRGQGLELGDEVGAERRPARFAPRQVDLGFEHSGSGANDNPGRHCYQQVESPARCRNEDPCWQFNRKIWIQFCNPLDLYLFG